MQSVVQDAVQNVVQEESIGIEKIASLFVTSPRAKILTKLLYSPFLKTSNNLEVNEGRENPIFLPLRGMTTSPKNVMDALEFISRGNYRVRLQKSYRDYRLHLLGNGSDNGVDSASWTFKLKSWAEGDLKKLEELLPPKADGQTDGLLNISLDRDALNKLRLELDVFLESDYFYYYNC